MAQTIKNLRKRIAKMEDILSSAACGDLDGQLDVDTVDSDQLTALETGINLLIANTGSEVRQSKQRAIELEEKLKLIEQQRKAIEELSTPIIKIWEQVLVLPLIGTLDTRRPQRLTEALLTNIAATQTKVTILDITGIRPEVA